MQAKDLIHKNTIILGSGIPTGVASEGAAGEAEIKHTQTHQWNVIMNYIILRIIEVIWLFIGSKKIIRRIKQPNI